MKLFELVRNKHSSAATGFLSELLEQKPEHLQGSIDTSIETVLDGFASVAADQGGRELLYEAIRYSDDVVVEDPAAMFRDRDSRDVFLEANNRLAGLVGVANKERMISSLQSRENLSAVDAENMLGYVTPGVMGVLKGQIARGEVLDNPDGIGQMFLGEGDLNRVDTTKPPVSGGRTTGGAAVAAQESGSDMSWLVRYAMPAVLLGGLVLGGLNNCGNRAENTIIADQRMQLQNELDTVRAEAEEAKGQIATLKTDFTAATEQSNELSAQAESLTAELDGANGRVSELEMALSSAAEQGDAAKAKIEELGTQTASLEAGLSGAKDRITLLEGELNTAVAEGDAVKAELDTANAEIEAAKARMEAAAAELDKLNAETATLTDQLGTAESQVDLLQGELQTTRGEASSLRGQVEAVTAELDQVKALPTETSALQGLLSNVTAERDASVDARAVINGKLQTAINERNFAKSKAAELQSELDNAVIEIADKDEALKQMDVIQDELASVTAARDEAVQLNGQFETANAGLQQQVDFGAKQIGDLESRLRTSTERLAVIDTQLTDTANMLDVEKSSRADDVNRLTSTSNDLQAQLTDMLGMRDEAVNTLAMRDSEVTSLGEKVNALQTEIQGLEEANASAAEEAMALQQQIESLNGDLESTQAKVDGTNAVLADREESLAAVNTDLENATNALEAVTTERDELMNKRDALASRVKELIGERDAVVAETVELNGTIDALNSALDAEKQAGVESQDKLGLLNNSMNGLQKELALITGARDEASQQARDFRTQAGNLEKQVTQLESELALAQSNHAEAMQTMQTESNAMGEQIEGLSNELTATKEELQQATGDLAALNEEKAKAMAEIEALQNQGVTLQSSLDTEVGKVADLESKLAGLESDNSSLTNERDTANDQIGMLNEEVASLKGDLESEQSNAMKLSDTIAALETTNAGIVKERDDAMGTVEMLQGKLSTSEAQADELATTGKALQMAIEDAAAAAQARIDSTLAVRDEITGRLGELGVSSATVSSIEDDTAVAITLGSGDLYGVGSATLSKSGNELLTGVGQVIAGYTDWHVDVEGHTDSQGIGEVLRQKYPTNWELSSARASAAVRYLSANVGIDSSKVSARGFADTRPLASNESAEGREQNRRVEIILRRR